MPLETLCSNFRLYPRRSHSLGMDKKSADFRPSCPAADDLPTCAFNHSISSMETGSGMLICPEAITLAIGGPLPLKRSTQYWAVLSGKAAMARGCLLNTLGWRWMLSCPGLGDRNWNRPKMKSRSKSSLILSTLSEGSSAAEESQVHVGVIVIVVIAAGVVVSWRVVVTTCSCSSHVGTPPAKFVIWYVKSGCVNFRHVVLVGVSSSGFRSFRRFVLLPRLCSSILCPCWWGSAEYQPVTPSPKSSTTGLALAHFNASL